MVGRTVAARRSPCRYHLNHMTEEQLTDSTDTSETTTDNSRQALTEQKSNKPWQFQPGVSGNPGGRPPKHKTLTGALEGVVKGDELAQKLWAIASGETAESQAIQLEAMKYVFARIEGNPIQAMRHQIEGAVGPLIFLHPGKVIEAQSNQELDTEANTLEGEVLDDVRDSDTSSDPAGPPSI